MQVKGNSSKMYFFSVFYDAVGLYSREQQDKLTSWKGYGRKQAWSWPYSGTIPAFSWDYTKNPTVFITRLWYGQSAVQIQAVAIFLSSPNAQTITGAHPAS